MWSLSACHRCSAARSSRWLARTAVSVPSIPGGGGGGGSHRTAPKRVTPANWGGRKGQDMTYSQRQRRKRAASIALAMGALRRRKKAIPPVPYKLSERSARRRALRRRLSAWLIGTSGASAENHGERKCNCQNIFHVAFLQSCLCPGLPAAGAAGAAQGSRSRLVPPPHRAGHPGPLALISPQTLRPNERKIGPLGETERG